jgi:hypothetical protein
MGAISDNRGSPQAERYQSAPEAKTYGRVFFVCWIHLVGHHDHEG